MKRPKRILVAPLNWGLGHASRCIPIINELLQKEFEVILASDGRSLQLLQKEFPKLQTIELPPYDIQYSTENMVFNIACQIPKILFAVWKENRLIKKIAKKEKINIIISDNRYGCKNDQTKNIFITHQVNIIIPFKPLEWITNKINHFLINQFDECWIPDFKGEKSLAGRLSKSDQIKNVKYLGLLSRMIKINTHKKYDIIAVISGPEPQRTKFEELIIKELKPVEKKCLIIQGITNVEKHFQINDNIEVISYLNSKGLNVAIESSELVICRSGYSSIMDLMALGKKAILVPTPGQTEQEYLAERLINQGNFQTQNQRSFSIQNAIIAFENINEKFKNEKHENQLHKAIFDLSS